jgi:tRNA dimethylallyltransferase
VRELVRGRISREGAHESIVRATRQLAKRQRTWFRAVPEVMWIAIGGEKDLEPAARKIAEGIVREMPGGGT